MKFKKIHLTIPRKVSDIFKQISSIERNSCIAGGFLCDLYMRKPYRDIDIFIKYRNEEKTNKILKMMKEEGFECEEEIVSNNEYEHFLEVYTYTKGKWKIQLIFGDTGISQVKRFDFTFREFLYFKGSSYASYDALNAIENKRLELGVTQNAFKTLFRVFDFSTKYNLHFSYLDFNTLAHYFNNRLFFQDSIKDDINNYKKIKENQEALILFEEYFEKNENKESFTSMFKLKSDYDTSDFPLFSLNNSKRLKIDRDICQKIFTVEKTKTISSYVNQHAQFHLDNLRIRMIDKTLELMKAERLPIILQGKVEELEFIEERLKKGKKEPFSLENIFSDYESKFPALFEETEDFESFSFWYDDAKEEQFKRSSFKLFKSNELEDLIKKIVHYNTDRFSILKIQVEGFYFEKVVKKSFLNLKNKKDFLTFGKGNFDQYFFPSLNACVLYNKITRKAHFSIDKNIKNDTESDFLVRNQLLDMYFDEYFFTEIINSKEKLS